MIGAVGRRETRSVFRVPSARSKQTPRSSSTSGSAHSAPTRYQSSTTTIPASIICAKLRIKSRAFSDGTVATIWSPVVSSVTAPKGASAASAPSSKSILIRHSAARSPTTAVEREFAKDPRAALRFSIRLSGTRRKYHAEPRNRSCARTSLLSA